MDDRETGGEEKKSLFPPLTDEWMFERYQRKCFVKRDGSAAYQAIADDDSKRLWEIDQILSALKSAPDEKQAVGRVVNKWYAGGIQDANSQNDSKEYLKQVWEAVRSNRSVPIQMQKKKVTRALQAVGQYPGKALFIAKPKKLITAMENLLDLADMCGLTVADEDAARYTQDGLPQKLASSLRTGLKVDYNKFQPLIKAIRDEINEHGEGCFLSWESEAEREQRERSEQLKANLTTTTQQQQQSPPGLLIWQQALRDEMQNQMQALYTGQAGVPPRLPQRQRGGYGGSNAVVRQQPWPRQRQEPQQQFNQRQQWMQ